ncbi:hypothetical protein FRC08_000465 [Ceratobasidium sp. 394]|nr:hypothetical protein FRC08_000465 [Ceratobasidium sp. 394]
MVPFTEWNECVASAALTFDGPENERYKRFPSTKIQSTIEGMTRADEYLRSQGAEIKAESGGAVRLDTCKAEVLSQSLKSARQIGREHVEKWIGYWEKKGLFG